jgi:Ca2+-binding RTX toxin-like protein
VKKGGDDYADGGGGDDTILYDSRDVSLSGGEGGDLLEFGDSPILLDMTEPGRPSNGALRPSIASIETMDFTNGAADILVLSAQSMYNMGNTNHTLTADVEVGDRVFLQNKAGWTFTANSGGYDIYTIDHPGPNSTLVPLTLKVTAGTVVNDITVGTARTGVVGQEANGTSGSDVIKTGNGDDLIVGGAGVDVIDAGDGDDVVTYDVNDRQVFGGSGDDVLVITTAGDVNGDPIADFSFKAGTQVKGFEVIDLTSAGGQTVKLDEPSVLALSDTGRVTVKGTAADGLVLYGAWTYFGVDSDATGAIYKVLQKGEAFVSVSDEVDLTIANELGGVIAVGSPGTDTV